MTRLYTSIEKNVMSELWPDTATVTASGWTLVGSPTVDNGLVLNGSTQRASLPLLFSQLSVPNITFAIRFTPDFAYDENVDRALMDSSSGSRYLILKRRNAYGNVILIYLGNVNIASIPSAGYSAYWNVGEENTLVVSGRSGRIDAWLNGHKILNGKATAWGITFPSVLYIGSSYAGTTLFDGTIWSLEVFADKWDDAQESIWRQSTSFTAFTRNADAYIDMSAIIGTGVDPDFRRVVDKSGNENSPRVADGTYLAYAPDFRNPGFYFDGNPAFLQWYNQSGFYNNAEQTIICCFEPHFLPDEDEDRYMYDSQNTYRYVLIKRSNTYNNILWPWLGNTGLTTISESKYRPYWNSFGRNVAITSGTSGYNNFWLNGAHLIVEGTTAWTPKDPQTVHIGTYYGKDDYWFKGVIYHFSTYPFLISGVQARYITNLLLGGL